MVESGSKHNILSDFRDTNYMLPKTIYRIEKSWSMAEIWLFKSGTWTVFFTKCIKNAPKNQHYSHFSENMCLAANFDASLLSHGLRFLNSVKRFCKRVIRISGNTKDIMFWLRPYRRTQRTVWIGLHLWSGTKHKNRCSLLIFL